MNKLATGGAAAAILIWSSVLAAQTPAAARGTLRLTQVAVEEQSGGVVVTLSVSGAVTPTPPQMVTEPTPRVFLDLPGVAADVPAVTPVGKGRVARVRVAVNAVDPLVTRVVVDLVARAAFKADLSQASSGTIRIVITGTGPAPSTEPSARATAPRAADSAPPRASPAARAADPPPTSPESAEPPKPAEARTAVPAAAPPGAPKIARRASADVRASYALSRDSDARLPKPLPLVSGTDPTESTTRDRKPKKNAPPSPDALVAEARALFAQGRFEAAAETAARGVQLAPADPMAQLVLARSTLERYRQTASVDELKRAVESLRGINGASLDAREQLDLMAGLALGLYMSGEFRAAAGLFETMLDRASEVNPTLRDHVLDWWATAMDRSAQALPPAERVKTYEQVLSTVTDEIRRDPGSASGSYWTVAAVRGQGDLDRAWDLAIAGWVRAQLTRDGGADLRDDLDRLVTSTLIPERAKRLGATGAAANELESLLATEWRSVKEKWAGR